MPEDADDEVASHTQLAYVVYSMTPRRGFPVLRYAPSDTSEEDGN